MKGIKYAWGVHSGSIAFGSLVMVIINAIKKAARQNEKEGGAAARCMNLCCSCIADFLEQLNKNSYAYMAITGDTYCTSAINGFVLYLRHFIEFEMAQFMASMLVFLGTLFICLINTLIFFGISKAANDDDNDMVYKCAIAFICSLATVSLCLNQFDEAILGIMMSMAVDMELNDDYKFGPPTFHEKMNAIRNEHEEQHKVNEDHYGQMEPR